LLPQKPESWNITDRADNQSDSTFAQMNNTASPKATILSRPWFPLQVVADADDGSQEDRLFLLLLLRRRRCRRFPGVPPAVSVLPVQSRQQDVDGGLFNQTQDNNNEREELVRSVRRGVCVRLGSGRWVWAEKRSPRTDGAPSISSMMRQLGLWLVPSTDFICVAVSMRFWNTSALRSSLA